MPINHSLLQIINLASQSVVSLPSILDLGRVKRKGYSGWFALSRTIERTLVNCARINLDILKWPRNLQDLGLAFLGC